MGCASYITMPELLLPKLGSAVPTGCLGKLKLNPCREKKSPLCTPTLKRPVLPFAHSTSTPGQLHRVSFGLRFQQKLLYHSRSEDSARSNSSTTARKWKIRIKTLLNSVLSTLPGKIHVFLHLQVCTLEFFDTKCPCQFVGAGVCTHLCVSHLF